MSTMEKRVETMFEADMAAAKPIEIAKPDEIDELDVRLAYLEGIARAFDQHFPPLKNDEEA